MEKIAKEKEHDFHMVLRSELKSKICGLAVELGCDISTACVYILDKTLCILKKYQFNMEEVDEVSTYQRVDWDEDIHIYMEETYYRKIKHLADSMFAFSIAIVIRKLFEFYFEMLELSEFDAERVERIFKRYYLIYVKAYGKSILFWKKSLIKKQLLGEFSYFLEFNDKFSITSFNFIKSD